MKASTIGLIFLVLALILVITMISLGYKKEGFADKYGETNERGTFTMYYADWCPHCQNVKPLFKDFMGSGIVKVNGLPVRVRMIEEKEMKGQEHPDIKGFPSFLYSDSARKTVEFNGPRTADGFMEFLKTQILS